MESNRRQLGDLMSTVAGCQTLLRSTVARAASDVAGHDRAGPQTGGRWLTEPRSALVRAQMMARVTDLQLEALSAIESFCLLCHPPLAAASNTSNAGAASGAFPHYQGHSSASEPDQTGSGGHQRQVAVCVNSADQDTLQAVGAPVDKARRRRSTLKSCGLGAFRSAIIRQLWEIHRLLLALVDETPGAGAADTADARRHGLGGSPPAVVVDIAAVEMPLDSSTTNGEGSSAKQPPPPALERHNWQPSPQKSVETAAGHQRALSGRSVSEWSFACAHTSGRQLCFASTLCVGPLCSVARARKVASDYPTLDSGDAESRDSGSDSYVTLLSQSYSMNDCVAGVNKFDAVQNLSSSSNTTGSMEQGHKCGDSIVFQRVLRVAHISRKMPAQKEKLVTTLSRLKTRIDAIKLNLAESVECSDQANERPSHGRRSGKRAPRGAARNQSNRCANQQSYLDKQESALRRIKARLDIIVGHLTQMLESAMSPRRRQLKQKVARNN